MKLLSLCRPWQKRSSSSSESSWYTNSFSLRYFKYEELKKATKDFSSEAQLGNKSCFDSVHLGVLPDSTRVAVKILPTNIISINFWSDVWRLKEMHHINLVRLIGLCDEVDDIRLLVFDYFPNRSLDLHLFQPPVVLDWNRRYHIALGTARALARLHRPMEGYQIGLSRDLHGRITHLIHGRIKPENIILDSDFCPKVSDYGLFLFLGPDEYYRILASSGKTTTSYVAPEVMSERDLASTSDVYSYGMVLFEIISGIRNCENGEAPKSFPTRVARVIRAGGGQYGHDILSILDRRLAGDNAVDEDDVLRVCKVACWCVHDDPKRRPSMEQVVDVLEGVIDDDDGIIDLSSWSL